MANSKNFARNLANGRVNSVDIQYFINEAKAFASANSDKVQIEVLEDKQLWD